MSLCSELLRWKTTFVVLLLIFSLSPRLFGSHPAVSYGGNRTYHAGGIQGSATLTNYSRDKSRLIVETCFHATSGFNHVANPYLQPGAILPVRIVVFDSDRKFVCDLIPAENPAEAEAHAELITAPQFMGRRFEWDVAAADSISISSPVEGRGRIEIPPGDYEVQAVYLDGFFAPQTIKEGSNRDQFRERLRSNVISWRVAADDVDSVKVEDDEQMGLVAQISQPQLSAGRTGTMQVMHRLLNRSNRTLSIFNPFLVGFALPMPAKLVVSDLESGGEIAATHSNDGSKVSFIHVFFRELPPNGVCGMPITFASPPRAGRYRLQMIYTDQYLSEFPIPRRRGEHVARDVLDEVGPDQYNLFLNEWIQRHPGHEAFRSKQVEFDVR